MSVKRGNSRCMDSLEAVFGTPVSHGAYNTRWSQPDAMPAAGQTRKLNSLLEKGAMPSSLLREALFS
jgi:hypothetical protein